MKKILKSLIIISSLGLMISCSSNDEQSKKKIIFQNNFDQLIGWTPNNPYIIKGSAHSGQYCFKMDTTVDFSLGFHEYINKISDKTLNTIKFSAWCKMDQMPSEKINLVCSIDADGKSFTWSGVRLKDNIQKPNEWAYISGMAKIPVNIPPYSIAKLYVFSPLKEVCYIDDMEISFE